MTLFGDALGAAVKKRSLDIGRLRKLLDPLADRSGFKLHSFATVLDRLLKVAGLDLDAVARRVSADSVLLSNIIDIQPRKEPTSRGQLDTLG